MGAGAGCSLRLFERDPCVLASASPAVGPGAVLMDGAWATGLRPSPNLRRWGKTVRLTKASGKCLWGIWHRPMGGAITI